MDGALGPMESPTEAPIHSGLPRGAFAPAFELESLARGRVVLSQLSSSSSQFVLLFVDPACSP
ncbi:hypothetical protein, partial [Salmonella sp. SAL4447]|uniref:hypothetical protein n=1 Tax=Salmonella sp. SAL4447 TaxID=3159902 RepID=UPI00397CF4C6